MKTLPIAVIGVAVRLPDADKPETFWTNLCTGHGSIKRIADVRSSNPNHVPFSAFPDNIEFFDAPFFGITPHEAEIMDPQHRMLLECAWEACESAGYEPTSYPGKVGVFAGCALNSYLLCNLMTRPQYLTDDKLFPLILGSNPDFLATRVSYKLNLRGPSHTVQSACSTSLLAVHQACRSLQMNECEMALAGGVALNLKLRDGYTYVEGGIFSADGTCRAFDADATGTVFGNGAGVVLLKPLAAAIEDGDSIWAVIRGSAVNNDGGQKVGFTAPRMEGQAEVIAEALRNADLSPDTISYIETHGTGTPLGDPIEFAALAHAYLASAPSSSHLCAIGSVKTNIGHLDAAAGITGFVKTVLALKHGRIPPTLHFRKANPQIAFSSTPFYVNTELVDWTVRDHPRRAGVSAFGVGGTNVHVILEEAPATPAPAQDDACHLIRLSARSETALLESAFRLGAWLDNEPDASLGDVAYTLQVGRKTHSHRSVCVASSVSELRAHLRDLSPESVATRHDELLDQRVVFVFPGQETAHTENLRWLYENEEIFRNSIDRCSAIVSEHVGQDVGPLLFGTQDSGLSPQRSELADTTLFAVDYALAKLWMERSVLPGALLGYSLGEFVAACLSGVFALEEALPLIAARATAIEATQEGCMLAVSLDETTCAALCKDYGSVSVAAIYTPGQCVLSGDITEIDQMQVRLHDGDIQTRRLNTARALQSPLMNSAIQASLKQLDSVRLAVPQIPFLSNITGTWITPSQAASKEYWAEHICRPLRFHDCVTHAAVQMPLFLEVGEGDVLTRLLRRHPDKAIRDMEVVASLDPGLTAERSLLVAASRLWLRGVSVAPEVSRTNERRSRISLPTYPFERQRYWIEADRASQNAQAESKDPTPVQPVYSAPLAPRPTLSIPFLEPTGKTEIRLAALWQETLGVTPIGAADNFFDLGGDSLIGIELIEYLKKEFTPKIVPVDLYERLTIRSLAEFLDHLSNGEKLPSAEPPRMQTKTAYRAHRQAALSRGPSRQVQLTEPID